MNKRKGEIDSDRAIGLAVILLVFCIIVISMIGFPLYLSHVNYQNQTLKTILDNMDINEDLYSIELTDEELIIRKKDEYQDNIKNFGSFLKYINKIIWKFFLLLHKIRSQYRTYERR